MKEPVERTIINVYQCENPSIGKAIKSLLVSGNNYFFWKSSGSCTIYKTDTNELKRP